ncbi:hypothetical protein [Proteus terrae]|uniref:hypothetical protein n=1 Tax=Proteus terrae TaxID=1574161 RepID=UPI001BA6B1A2|nr:hypothetical protein [Proteus terrae]
MNSAIGLLFLSLTVSSPVTYAFNVFSHPTTQTVVHNDISRQITAWFIIFAPFNQHPPTMK